jgi:hypothetical protein
MPVAPSSTANQIDEPRIETSLCQDACRAPFRVDQIDAMYSALTRAYSSVGPPFIVT